MSTFTDVREIGSKLQNYNMEIFKEPRGTMRILQFVFALVNIIVLRSYSGSLDITYGLCSTSNPSHIVLPVEYPFNLDSVSVPVSCSNSTAPIVVSLKGDFSSEAELLTTTCWASIVFVIIISVIYVKYREAYESNGNLALADFIVSVLLAVLWIGSVGAWWYGQNELKNLTSSSNFKKSNYCNVDFKSDIKCLTVERSSVTGITISMILSCLNFFLWAASLWFLYKETPWYLQFQRA